MKITNKAIWQEMYRAAERVRDLKAWEWMDATDMFCVVNPEKPDEYAFCAMTNNEEYRCLMIFQGMEGYDNYYGMLDAHHAQHQTSIFNMGFMLKGWMVEFTNADEMNHSSKETLKNLGIKYRGKGNWVDISDKQPGYLHWYVKEEDVPFITICLNQFFEIALKAETEGVAFLHRPNPDYQTLLSEYNEEEEDEERQEAENWGDQELILSKQAHHKKDDKWQWQETYLDLDDDQYIINSHRIVPSVMAAAAKKKLPKRDNCILYGMNIIPTPVQGDENDAPALIFVTVFLQYGNNAIIHQDINTIGNIAERFEHNLLETFETMGHIPSQIVVNMDIAADWLEAYAEFFDIELIIEPYEESFDVIFKELLSEEE